MPSTRAIGQNTVSCMRERGRVCISGSISGRALEIRTLLEERVCIFRGEASEVNQAAEYISFISVESSRRSLSTRYWPARAPSADPTQAPHAARSSTSSSAAARSQSSAGIGGRTRVSARPIALPSRLLGVPLTRARPPSQMPQYQLRPLTCALRLRVSQSAQGTTTTGYSSLQGLFSGLYQLLPPPLRAPPSPPHPCLHQRRRWRRSAAARRSRLSCTPPHVQQSVEAPQHRQVEAVRRRKAEEAMAVGLTGKS